MRSDVREIEELVRANGCVASRTFLLGRGVAPRAIDSARRLGVLELLKKGTYGLPDADIDQRRAVALRGRIGCISALRRVGVWAGTDPALHVHVATSASRLHLAEVVHLGRDPDVRRTDEAFWAEPGIPRVHWQKRGSTTHSWGSDWLVDPLSSLRQAALCLDDEHAVAAIDSALRRKVVRIKDLDHLFSQLPQRLARLRAEIDPLADSGPESVVRVRMRRVGFIVEPQVRIPGSSRLDLLINGVVGLDIDSRMWHSDEKRVTWDYDKTLQSVSLGLPTLRILPHHIFESWPSTLAAISRAVSDMTELHESRGRHRSTGRS